MADASIVEVPIQRNSRDENKEIKQGNVLKTGNPTRFARKILMHSG